MGTSPPHAPQLVAVPLLKRQFRPVHLLQIPVVFVFGMLTDFSMWLAISAGTGGVPGPQ